MAPILDVSCNTQYNSYAGFVWLSCWISFILKQKLILYGSYLKTQHSKKYSVAQNTKKETRSMYHVRKQQNRFINTLNSSIGNNIFLDTFQMLRDKFTPNL